MLILTMAATSRGEDRALSGSRPERSSVGTGAAWVLIPPLTNGLTVAKSLKNASNNVPFWLFAPPQGGNPAHPFKFLAPTNRIPLSASLEPSLKLLKPGIYEASPFAALVVVPPPGADESRMIIAPGKADTAMPMFRPELRFIPRPPQTALTLPSER